MEIVKMVLSLLLGMAGGVVVAGPIARRGAAAQRSYEAQLRLFRALQGYRNQLKDNHDQLIERNQFPPGYASWPGRESLAETVLSDLPFLPRRKRGRVRQLLQQLVGSTTCRLVETRLHVPAEYRSEVSDKDRAVRILQEAQDTIAPGLLRQLKRTDNDPRAHEPIFKEVLEVLENLIALMKPRP